MDFDQKFSTDILTDVLTWDYQSTFPPGYFETIAASPPCTEYSIAMTCRARDLDMADATVRRAIDIFGYYQPRMCFIENPRTGLLKSRDFMQPYVYVDVDYCQFCDWGYQKPTRVWGPMYFQKLKSRTCDGTTCPNLIYHGTNSTTSLTPGVVMPGRQPCGHVDMDIFILGFYVSTISLFTQGAVFSKTN